MKLNTYKQVKIYYINKEEKTFRVKKKKVFGLNKTLTDNTGKEYQLFSQDELQFYVDIPINDPNIGIVIDGVFSSICRTSYYKNNFEKVKEVTSKYDFKEGHNLIMKSLDGLTEKLDK